MQLDLLSLSLDLEDDDDDEANSNKHMTNSDGGDSYMWQSIFMAVPMV